MPKDVQPQPITSGTRNAALIKARLEECLGDLDRLELHHPAALVAMAIDQLGQSPTDPAPIG